MAVTEIPWGDGSGDKIYLTYPSASGDQTVQVSSDANTGGARSKVVTFTSGVGSIVRQLTVSQEAGVRQYIQDGLFLWLDGIDKGPDNTAWVDKVNGYTFTSNGAVFNAEHIYLNGSSFLVCSTIPSFPLTGEGTIEVVYENDGGYGVIIMPPSGTSGQVGFGIISGYGLMWSAGTNRPKYSDAPIKGSVSISVARAIGNGVSLTQNGSSYLSNGGSKPAYIGKRDYGAGNLFTGKIYCIRIYNRQLTQDEVLYNFGIDDSRFNLGATDYIEFEDANVGTICVSNWGDGVGLTRLKAGCVMNSQFGTTFRNNTSIRSFDELQYFTGLTQLLSNAFYGCTALQSIILPPRLTTIASDVFNGCSSLAEIDIPSSVATISSASFYNCSSLMTVVVRRMTPPTLSYSNTFQRGPAGRKYYVPYSADHSIIDLYKATSRWSELANSIYELNPDGTIPT